MAVISEASAPVSKLKIETGPKFPIRIFRTTLARPWLLLCLELVVSALATYMTIVDRMQYMLLWHTFNCVLARAWVE